MCYFGIKHNLVHGKDVQTMATNPREHLKQLIDQLSEEEAESLLNQLGITEENDVSFEDIKDKYNSIKDRFEDAFIELAQ